MPGSTKHPVDPWDLPDEELRLLERDYRHLAEALLGKANRCCAIRRGRSAAAALREANLSIERARAGVCICDSDFGMNLSCPVHQMGGREALGL